jgi:hypothetical protein
VPDYGECQSAEIAAHSTAGAVMRRALTDVKRHLG